MNKVLIFLFSLWLLTGCSSKHSINESQITVSILPQKYFIEQIVGNIFNINVMIPPGASPATYEPLPKQIEEISRSKAYFSIGHLIFEETWLPKFKSNNPELKIFDLSDNIKIIENHYHHDGHHHTIDPHIWVSPRKVRIITSNIKDYLIKMKICQVNLQVILEEEMYKQGIFQPVLELLCVLAAVKILMVMV